MRVEDLERATKESQDDDRKKISDLQNKNDELLKGLEEQRLKLKDAKKKCKDIEMLRGISEAQVEDLSQKLKMAENEFGLCANSIEYFKSEFLKIHNNVRTIALQYVEQIKVEDLDTAIHDKIEEADNKFMSVPISNSRVSKELCLAHFQRVISSRLQAILWQPFSSEQTVQDSKQTLLFNQIYDRLAKSFSEGRSGFRAARTWAALTVRSLDSQSTSTKRAAHTFRYHPAMVKFSLLHETYSWSSSIHIVPDVDPSIKLIRPSTCTPSTFNSSPSISPTLSSSTSSKSHPSPPMASPSQHSPEARRQIAEARVALEASMSNIGSNLDHTLRSRAENLHANSKQLEKQQKDVVKATADLHKESAKLQKLADEGSKKIKELGNVQNWAEMLERDFLVLGETLRLANLPSDKEWQTSDGEESMSESDDEERMKRFAYGEHKFIPEESPAIESPAVGSPRIDSPRVMDADGDTMVVMEDTGAKISQEQDQKMILDDAPEQIPPPGPAYGNNIEEPTKLDKGKGRAIEVTNAEILPHRETITEHFPAEQQQDIVGSYATATTGSSSDPSSSSIHTAASRAS